MSTIFSRWRTAACAIAAASLLSGLAPSSRAEPSPDTNSPLFSGIDSLLDQSHRNASDSHFLAVDEAFRLSASVENSGAVRLTWVIAPGYYLYRSRIRVTSPNASIGAVQLPPGRLKSDAYLGRQTVYHEELIARLPLTRRASAPLELKLRVGYQGCAEAGLCYPPQTRELSLPLPAAPSGG